MIGREMAARSPARFLAPLALIAAIVGVAIVVAASRPGGTTTARSVDQPIHRAHAAKPRKRFYVVQSGDNLTVIATKTGVGLDRLQSLNPGVDPQALHVGERLKLTP